MSYSSFYNNPNDNPYYGTGGMSADEPASELASPWIRLAAWIIDSLIYIVVLIIMAIIAIVTIGIGFSDLTDIETIRDIGGVLLAIVALAILAPLVIFIIQMALLGTRGQTIGKILLKIRIVDAQTGAHPGWARLILLRTIVGAVIIQGALNAIPLIGRVLGFAYFLVDSLFIFRPDHRTIHDLIAGTRVDKVAP